MPTLSVNIDHIVKGCQQYEAASQEALYRHCYPTMFAVCSRYTPNRDDAAALYNEGMLKVFQNIEKYKGEGNIMAWIRRILVNTCIDHCRKSVKYHLQPVDQQYEEQFGVENHFEETVSSEQVVKWLQNLPSNTGLVFNMYCLEGYTIEEVAASLNITVGTAKWHVSEARKKLRTELSYFIKQTSNAE
jgi:RNA polymerase sigma-70 factor, ECF subfamily